MLGDVLILMVDGESYKRKRRQADYRNKPSLRMAVELLKMLHAPNARNSVQLIIAVPLSLQRPSHGLQCRRQSVRRKKFSTTFYPHE